MICTTNTNTVGIPFKLIPLMFIARLDVISLRKLRKTTSSSFQMSGSGSQVNLELGAGRFSTARTCSSSQHTCHLGRWPWLGKSGSKCSTCDCDVFWLRSVQTGPQSLVGGSSSMIFLLTSFTGLSGLSQIIANSIVKIGGISVYKDLPSLSMSFRILKDG